MAKPRSTRRRQRRARERSGRQHAPRRRSALRNWKTVLGWGAGALLLLGVGALVIRGSGQSTEDPALVALAEQASGGPVRVLTGPAHTVYHSELPLPSVAAPREDGRPTLIWFSATTCTFCERMESYVYSTVSRFSERVVFVEKSVTHDRGASSRYGIRGTPTFVLVDAVGDEVRRFFFQTSESAFADSILTALSFAES